MWPAPPTSTKSMSGKRAMNSSARSLVTRSLIWPRTRKHGHAIPQNRFNRRVHPIHFGHFDGRQRRSAVDEFRIPVPVPAAIAVAQVGPESVEIRWPGAVRVVLLDRVSDLVQ